MGQTIGGGKFNDAESKQPEEELKSARRKADQANVDEYTDRAYKRYHFLPDVNDTISAEVRNMTEK